MPGSLQDRIAIEETKARYCRCLDTKDWSGFASVFVEDLVLDTTDSGGAAMHGRDQAVEMVRKSGDAALTAEILALLGSSFVERGYVRFYAEAFRSPLPLSRSVIETAFDHDGCVIYGPYVRLPYGEQEITFHVRASGLEDGQELAGRIWCDVAQDLTTVALTELTGQEGARTLRRGEIKLLLFNSAPHASFEFRIFTSGHPFNGKLAFYGVSVEPVCAG